MQTNIIYIGLDVDDNSYHGCGFKPDSGEIIEFKLRPTLKALMDKLQNIQKLHPNFTLKVCYEASYIGFTILRDLMREGFHCDVVAPNSIPRVAGNQVKTDRLDAAKLAQFYANGLLTVVTPPEPEQEKDRDLLRSRHYLVKQLSELRGHIHSLLRRHGFNFLQETRLKTYWSKSHLDWIERTISKSVGSFKRNLELLFQQLKWLQFTISEYNTQIEMLAETDTYKKPVQALTCYKGVKNLFALTMITEIGDIKRFPHPRQLVSWVGMDIREYSSGGKHNRFGITKHGNPYLRTAFVEANQRVFRSTLIGEDLKLRRKTISPTFIHIADRCLDRLRKKGTRLLHGGKHPNKVKVACAREMIGFVWESLNVAQAN